MNKAANINQGRGRPKGQGPHGEPTKPVRIPLSLMPDVRLLLDKKGFKLPMYASNVPAGNPLKLENYTEDYIDLNQMMIREKESFYLVRVKGDSMVNAGIRENDILVVDGSREAIHKDIVIAGVNDELTVKRLFKNGDSVMLVPENPDYDPIFIGINQELEIYGVVDYVIHKAA